jgi:hypothetical protein
MLDSDLATLLGVSTGRLNEQVRRNLRRFPADFKFQLTRLEVTSLISQIAISKPGRGGRQKLPRAFTEHGAVMVATVLSSPRAVQFEVTDCDLTHDRMRPSAPVRQSRAGHRRRTT